MLELVVVDVVVNVVVEVEVEVVVVVVIDATVLHNVVLQQNIPRN